MGDIEDSLAELDALMGDISLTPPPAATPSPQARASPQQQQYQQQQYQQQRQQSQGGLPPLGSTTSGGLPPLGGTQPQLGQNTRKGYPPPAGAGSSAGGLPPLNNRSAGGLPPLNSSTSGGLPPLGGGQQRGYPPPAGGQQRGYPPPAGGQQPQRAQMGGQPPQRASGLPPLNNTSAGGLPPLNNSPGGQQPQRAQMGGQQPQRASGLPPLNNGSVSGLPPLNNTSASGLPPLNNSPGGQQPQRAQMGGQQPQRAGGLPPLNNTSSGGLPPLNNTSAGGLPPLNNTGAGALPPLGSQQPQFGQNTRKGYPPPTGAGSSASAGGLPLNNHSAGGLPPLNNTSAGGLPPLNSSTSGGLPPLGGGQQRGYPPPAGGQQPQRSQQQAQVRGQQPQRASSQMGGLPPLGGPSGGCCGGHPPHGGGQQPQRTPSQMGGLPPLGGSSGSQGGLPPLGGPSGGCCGGHPPHSGGQQPQRTPSQMGGFPPLGGPSGGQQRGYPPPAGGQQPQRAQMGGQQPQQPQRASSQMGGLPPLGGPQQAQKGYPPPAGGQQPQRAQMGGQQPQQAQIGGQQPQRASSQMGGLPPLGGPSGSQGGLPPLGGPSGGGLAPLAPLGGPGGSGQSSGGLSPLKPEHNAGLEQKQRVTARTYGVTPPGASPSGEMDRTSAMYGPGAETAAKVQRSHNPHQPAAAADAPSLPTLATHTPDGRELVYQAEVCARCNLPIVGVVLDLGDIKFHRECFTCWHCAKRLEEDEFFEQEERPYCEECWFELFCPRCDVCKEPVSDQVIEAFGKHYHPHHFACFGCGTDLLGKVYREHEGDPYCEECKKARLTVIAPDAHECALCFKPIFGLFILVDGKYFHPEHFKCTACGVDCSAGNRHSFQNATYCEECYLLQIAKVCAACGKPIVGRSVSAQGRLYHPEHFVCTHCHCLLDGTHFREQDGKPYCDAHFAKLFCDSCSYCNQPVVGGGIRVFGKAWHPDCFVCHGCKRRLGQEFVPWDQKPFCRKCYKKLPSKTRKANESKLRAERRLDDKEKERVEKEARVAAKGQPKVLDPQEEWKRQALANAKAKRKAKANEFKERKKT